MCGWLRDRWGVPWQIVTRDTAASPRRPDPTVSGRVFAAMTEMVKLDIAALERAAADDPYICAATHVADGTKCQILTTSFFGTGLAKPRTAPESNPPRRGGADR